LQVVIDLIVIAEQICKSRTMIIEFEMLQIDFLDTL